MGSGQSARKLTIHNEEEIGVISVSNSVVQRLTQRAEQGAGENVKEVRPPIAAQPIGSAAMPPQQNPSGNTASGYSGLYHPEFTLTAIQIQRQKEQELQDQEFYWMKRVQNLEKEHAEIDLIFKEEYKRALQELAVTGQPTVNSQDSVQPCIENTQKVLKCYQLYPKESLKCSSLVEEFSSCVDKRRANLIATRC